MTINEIAEKANVSPATVSRVINNYPYVQKNTRARVLQVLAECNFVPNATAQSLVTNASKMIGILIADIRTTQHTDGIYYIEKEFTKNGYSCLIYNTGTDPEKQAYYIQMLSQRKIDAVVLMGSVYQNESVQNAIMIYLPNIPVAICNGYLAGPNIYGVVTDERTGLKECVKMLCEKGHKNMAFIANHFTPSNNDKVLGFEEGFKLYSKNGNYVTIVAGDETSEIYAATLNLVKEIPEIDAIIYAEDFLALIGIHALTEAGISIPSQIAVVGINNSKYAEISNPALTSIDNMLYDTSMIAVRNLLNVLEGERVNHKMMINVEIIERETT